MRSGLYRHNATTLAVRLTQQRSQTWEGNINSTIVLSATDDGVSTISKVRITQQRMYNLWTL